MHVIINLKTGLLSEETVGGSANEQNMWLVGKELDGVTYVIARASSQANAQMIVASLNG